MSGVVIVETLRRHLTSLLTIAFFALLAILGLASSRLASPFWPGLISLVALGAGAGLIGPEFSSGTLQLILVKPINRSVYLVSRVAGVVLFIAIAALLAFLCEAAGRVIWDATKGIDDAAIAMVNVVSTGALTCAILAFFGTFLRSYFNVGLYFLIQIVLGVVKSMFGAARIANDGFLGWLHDLDTRFPIFEDAIDWSMRNLFPDEPRTLDRNWLLMVWSHVLIAIVLACFVFRRREVPYGAD